MGILFREYCMEKTLMSAKYNLQIQREKQKDDQKMKFYAIHTSGHASIETLKKVVEKLKPESIIPIHTFYPDKYKILSNNVHQI